MKTLKRLMMVLLALVGTSTTFGSLPTKVFAPYVDTSLYPTFSVTGTFNQTGQKYYMLAFIIAGSGNQPTWNGSTPMSDHFMLSDIQSLRAAGGDVGVSFGGANGTPIDSVITDVNSLVSAYSSVIDTYSLTWIDFDIEGFWIADSASVSRRNQAAAKLQAKYPNLRISYTLPVLSSGLTQDGINVINGAKSAGVKIYCVNVMAMDYGGSVSDMAGAATSAASATRSQTGLNIGITPMIGQNDSQGEIFTINNAKTVLTFANANSYVVELSFWSAGRDNGGCPGQTFASATCSGLSQTDFQFTTTWKPYSGSSGGGGSLPAGWTDADIGSVGLAGSASYSSGTFSVTGSGADIFSTADAFNYAYQSVSGNQTIVARVASENGSQAYAKAGVMFRSSTSANAVEASVLLTPANGVALEVRPASGATSINVSGWIKSVLPPQWLKLVRSGSAFSGYYSANGSTWTLIATTNVTMSTTETAGLAVTAHSTSALNTATFDNVSISGSAPDFTLSASPSSQSVTAGNSTSYTVSVGNVNGFSGTVSFSAGGLPGGATASFNPTSVNSIGSSTLTVATTSATPAGSSTVTITGTSGTLTHNTSVGLTVNTSTTTNNFSGTFEIQNVASGLVLNNQGKLTNGAPITQWTVATSVNLDWTFIPTSNGYYQINSVKSGLDAVVQSASTAAGAKIVQWSFGSAGNDQWKPVANSDGSYTFFNLHSGLVLADPGSSTATSTQMDQETSNGGANQKWKLLKQ
jgi:hypothetical protein